MSSDTKAADDAQRLLSRPDETRFDFTGELGRRLSAVTRQWLLPAPSANPRILEMFRERDLQPYAGQVPWAGEFAGKYLTHAVQILRLTGDPELRKHLEWFVGELVGLQAEDGYLGPWPEAWRLRPGAPTCAEPWDAWGHYHVMLGLLLWHELTGDARALDCTRRMADLFCRRFLHGDERLHGTGSHEMNQAPVHTLAMLYRLTGEPDYLAMAQRIVEEFALPPAGDYYRQGLADVPFHETPKPRWESLHPIMGLVELYYATGEVDYRRAFENLWWSMLEGDRHNNGGFTSSEQATGNPYLQGAIETCCTVAWAAMSVEMLQLTGNSIVADELELTLLNSGLGLISPSGRWVTYNTPMDGHREASAHTIVFQARAGSPELNCCSVNGPRLLGLVGEWALLSGQPGELYLNYYGPGTVETVLPSGQILRLVQETAYPVDGDVELALGLDTPETFSLALRIPAWSQRSAVSVNGEPVSAPAPGGYLPIERAWQPGDTVKLELDMRLHGWTRPPSSATPFDAEWTVYGPIPRAAGEQDAHRAPRPDIAPDPGALESPPETIAANGESYQGATMRSWEGVLCLPRNLPPPTVVAVTTWISAEEGEFEFSFSADWWAAWWVNGRRVYSTFEHGNQAAADSYNHAHRFMAPVRRGRNILVVQVAGGLQHGCRVSMAVAGTAAPLAAPAGDDKTYWASLYRGPLLLAYDRALNGGDAARRPGLDGDDLRPEPGRTDRAWLAPQLLLRTRNSDGEPVQLCDFASAGLSGTSYTTWLPMRFRNPSFEPFRRTQPLRSRHLDESR